MKNKLLENRVKTIEERNSKVEKDKEWETSLLRRLIITTLTYFVVLFYLIAISAENPAITAVVPALGYFLSTLVMKSIKEWWITR